MADEIKKDNPETKPVATAAESAPQAAASPTPAAEAPVSAKETKEAAPIKKEKPSNCAGCNKSIKKKRWYYRAGKFYCTKRCWTAARKKEAKPEEAQAKT